MADKKVQISVELLKGKAAENYKKLSEDIVKSNTKIQDSVNSTADNTKKKSKETEKSNDKLSSSFGELAKKALVFGAGIYGIRKAFGALSAGMDLVNEVSKEFEKTMATVKAILKPTSTEFKVLSDEARRLGETTAFSASQAGEAFVALGKLGFTTSQIIASSTDVLNLAAGAQLDMSMAAELTARTLTQFGLAADQAKMVTDVMGKSFNISALNAESFSEAMKFAGPQAAKMGLSVEKATASIATLAQSGIEGTMAGTALRRIMLEIGDSSSKAAKLINRADFATLSFTEKLQILQTKNLSPSVLKDTFGLLSTTSAGILIDGAQTVEDFTKELENSDGTMKKMASTMLDTVAGAEQILKSATEGLGLAIGDAFGADKRTRIELYTSLITKATQFIKDHQGAIKAVSQAFTNYVSDWVVGAQVISESIIGVLKQLGLADKFRAKTDILADPKGIENLRDQMLALKSTREEVKSLTEEYDKLSYVSIAAGRGMALRDELTKSQEKELGLIKQITAAAGENFAREDANIDKLIAGLGGIKKAREKIISDSRPLFGPGGSEEALKGLAGSKNKTQAGSTGSTETEKERPIFGPGDMSKSFKDLQSAQKKAADLRAKELEAAKKLQDDLVLTNMSGDAKKLEEIKRFEDEKRAILTKGGQDTLALEKNVEAQRQALQDEANEVRKQKILDMTTFILDGAMQLGSALGNLSSVLGQNELNSEQKSFDKEVALNEARANSELAVAAASGASSKKMQAIRAKNEEVSAKIATEGAARLEAIRKENFERQKKFSLGQAVINIALGITRALGKGIPFGLIEAGIVGAAGALQIAAISAQKFADGGIVGGTSFTGDKVPALVNSGEMILNQRQQKSLLNGGTGKTTNITVEAPVVHVYGNANASDLRSAVEETYQEQIERLSRMMRDVQLHDQVA